MTNSKQKLKIAVLFGGTSQERDVSIASGAQVVAALRSVGHDVLAMDTQRGVLSLAEEKELFLAKVAMLPPSEDALALMHHESGLLFSSPEFSTIDVVFLALHGGTGENGTIQALLDFAGCTYTGSGHAASAVAMDKDMSKRLFVAAGIPTPDWMMLPEGFSDFKMIGERFGYPCVVKANQQGSTIGLSIVRKEAELAAAIALARSFDPEVMIEKFIAGRELTVGLLEDQPLAVGEIMIESETIFDYASKYQPNLTQEIFPANLPQEIEKQAKKYTLQAHRALKLTGYSRADFRLDNEGNLWCLEVNTLPGMTATSLLPQSAKACGISFPELCERICNAAIKKKKTFNMSTTSPVSTQVKVPAVGESITSGTISAWHKKNGEQVAVGDLLFTLETDKVSTEVTATEPGVLKTLVPEGAEVKIGEIVATIEAAPGEEKEEPVLPTIVKPAIEEKNTALKVAAPKSPLTEVSAVVEKVAPSLMPVLSGFESGRITRRKLTPLRRKIAAQLVAAQQTAAILTTFNECDMSAVMTLRKEVQESFQAKYGVKLGFMSFFIKAVVAALQAVPEVNVRLEEEELVENHYYDIGVAVGTEKGLIVPVIRNADQETLAGLERQLLEYATKAREGKIALADLQGGVFTISNGGVYGSLLSTPILNPPQSGILGMHAIQERPVARDGQIVIRPMMYLAHSYDHRVIDGKQAVAFLLKVKEVIEHPLRLL